MQIALLRFCHYLPDNNCPTTSDLIFPRPQICGLKLKRMTQLKTYHPRILLDSKQKFYFSYFLLCELVDFALIEALMVSLNYVII